ncbi:MAG: MG2 domain-containing protein [Bacteroidales bacterium]|nr:MG2 domain-containing protein [Bacteroidales bacterium]
MNIKRFLAFVIVLFPLIINAQNYDSQWKEFDENISKRLPESAAKVLDDIEKQAVKDKNDVQLLKVAVKRSEVFRLNSENVIDTTINHCKSYLPKLSDVSQAILKIQIAKKHREYSYKFKYNPDEIEGQYLSALENAKALKKTSMATYKPLFENENTKFDVELEPTAYDYVTHCVLDFYDDDLDEYLEKYNALYAQLIDFDNDKKHEKASVYNKINRIERLVDYFHDKEHNTLYFNELNDILKDCKDNVTIARIKSSQANIMMRDENYVEALKLCDEVIAIDSISDDYGKCTDCRKSILDNSVSIEMQNVQVPRKPIPAGFSYRNTTNPSYRIYKVDAKDIANNRNLNLENILKLLTLKEIVAEKTLEIPDETDYKKHSSLIALPALEVGSYIILMSATDDFDNTDKLIFNVFQVSNLTYAVHNFDGKNEIYTLNREMGSPIGGVKAEFFKEEYDYKKGEYVQNSKGSVTTDSEGYAVMPEFSSGFIINLFSGDDVLLSHDLIWNYNTKQNNFVNKVSLFTDRQIYRPGQTVQFKGICTRGDGKTNELLVNEKIEVNLVDANWQTVEKQSFVTDEFGAFFGSFGLPSDALNGDFHITTKDGSVYFKVEEYKRPTFEVTFNKPEKEYSIGDNVRVTGNVMAFSGFGIDNARYEYKITRRTTFPFRCWWWIFRNIEDEQIASGEGMTEVGGLFNIDFQLIPDNSVKARELPMFTYIINVKVTDAQGETHEDSYSINASYNKFNIALKTDPELSSNFGNVMTSDDLKDCKVVVSNISGNPASTNVECKIYKISDNERFTYNLGSFDRHLLKDEELKNLFPNFDFYNVEKLDLKDCEVVYENVMEVDGEADLFKKNAKLAAGSYVIELKSVDDTLSEYSEKFVFYEPKTKKMPFKSLCWSAIDNETAQPGDEVNLYIGSSADNVMAIVYVTNNENIRYSERIMLNDNVKRISFKVKEEDRGSLVFDAVFVRYNQKQEVSYNVSVSFDNMKLGVELNAERTNLLPGAEETWSVTIRDYKNNPAFASLLAGMYDSSLDAIVPSYYGNSWHFNMTPTYRKSSDFRFDGGFGSNHASLYSYHYNFFFNPAVLYSDVVLIQMFNSPRRNIMYKEAYNAAPTGGMVYESVAVEEETAEMPSAAVQDNADGDENHVEKEAAPVMPIRSNFNETAFFYPNLKTDENGNATFSFTMPDALTRWKLRMLAYTKDLKVGTLEKTFVTQKPVMIMADMPRFCYDEDTLWLVANVVNLSEETISPVAKLEVLDESGVLRVESEVVLSEKEIKMKEIPAGRSQSVRWKVAMKKDVNLLTFRFSAIAGNFSDAEQHVMPVLSTEVFMTQTFPLIAKGNEKKDYNFNFENEGERNHAITLNFSKNPTWYAVQALPYLDNGNERYAEAAFHRYFTNSVAKHVASSLKDSPEMKRLLESLNDDSSNTTMSELEKNQELKEIILNETPWVMDAKNEAEQRANISKLFDTEVIDKNIESALNLLEKRQKPSGGWPWVEGMPESALVTQYILGGLGRIESLTENKNADAIAEKAFHFIENDVVRRFLELKEAEKKDYHCGVMIVRELFVMSYFPKFETSAKFKEAKALYIGKLKNDWTSFNFEAQAGIALIFNRNGDKSVAMAILKSLRECAQKNDLGMYWVGVGVEDEARILEAFNEIDPKNEEIDAMRFWILGQKRTNMWDNDRATAEAVYAIVNRGTDWTNDNGEVTITISGDEFDLNNGEAGAGFVQKILSTDGDYSNVSIDNQTNHQVWGGMFRQYFVPIDKVRKSNEDMKMRRELFIERIEGDKTSYVPVSEGDIKVGDKIKIVLHIENQQDMEFVYLKDLRGACFEPTEQISRYHYDNGLWYYQSTSDVAMEFFFDNMPKGRHELSHTVYVTKEGSFSAGYAVVQCQYAPEFGAYSEGGRIVIK